MRMLATALVFLLSAHLTSSAGESLLEKKTKSAAPNTWVEVCREKTGYRTVAMFVHAPKLGKFVLSGGNIGKDRHFETELFDPAACKWTNAYPQGAPYKKASGPTDAPAYANQGPILKTDKNGVLRLRTDKRTIAYLTDSATHHQWTWNPDEGRLYAHLLGVTLAWDPATRKWTDTKAAPFKKDGSRKGKSFDLQWASMCCDPVNKEILSIGGNSDEDAATPGSWVFRIGAGKWEKLKPGSTGLDDLRARARAASGSLRALINAARNRFYHTESEAEAGADLAARGGKVLEEFEKLAAELDAARVEGHEAALPPRSGKCVKQAAGGLKPLLSGLKKPDGKLLVALQTLAEEADLAEHVLDAEPCGRAGSQMAYDASQKKIVLFGGNRLDVHLADTWVYDCKSRTWEQRFPDISPRPGTNRLLGYLPKAKRIVLAGGVPFEIWVYDTSKNIWKLLQHLPRSKKRMRYHEQPYCDGAPRGGIGAVGSDDVLVWTGTDYVKPGTTQPRVTWACRIDPSAPDAGSAEHGVSAGTVSVVWPEIAPEVYDREIKPDAAKVAELLKSMPANKWNLLPSPAKCTSPRGWGTVPYDPSRHQFVYWGGGHSTYKWSDTAHYSLRTATWSTGYRAEEPLRGCFTVDAIRFFSGRPQIPCHVWEGAAFDPPSGKVVFLTHYSWTYDPAKRDWDLPPARTPFVANPLRTGMTATPRGAVALTGGSLYLYEDQSRSWKALPGKGLPYGSGDGSGICYDSKRDCIWVGNSKKAALFRCDMKAGEVEQVPTNLAPGFVREVEYVPELDMLLSMNRKETPGGKVVNLAFDIENRQWVGLDLEFGDGKPHKPNHYWYYSRALAYDAELKLALFFDRAGSIASPGSIWVLRLEKDGLRRVEIK